MRSYLIQVLIVFFILFSSFISGCSQMQANPGTRNSTSFPNEQDAAARMDTQANNSDMQALMDERDDFQSMGPQQDDHKAILDTLAVPALSGYPEKEMIAYSLNSWTIYDKWDDIGISEDKLCPSMMVPEVEHGGGVLLVTLTLQNIDADIVVDMGLSFTAQAFGLTTQSELKNLGNSDDGAPLLFESEYPAVYFDGAGRPDDETEKQYFIISPIAPGQSITYTVGYVLSAKGRSAADSGELYLYYAAEPLFSVKDIQLLHLYSES